MRKQLSKRNTAELAVLMGLIFTAVMSFARFDAACEDLRQNVLRLHIIANSNSEADQAVKLLVRDRILEETADIFSGAAGLNEAEKRAAENLWNIAECAEETLKANGFGYGATAEIGNSYFETREYESFTLPAGNYRSLIIRLGKAEGKNWWCVVFPAVCIPAAAPEAELSDSTSRTSAEIAEHPQKYIMRFKAVEIFEDFKKQFDETFGY